MMNGGGMSGGFFGTGFIFIILILAIVAIGFWMMKGKNSERSPNLTQQQHSFELLKQRLARGEISEEEYDRLKRKMKD
ncbi:SHOCT domain-containing protein [Rossellomorea aquimaris]|uniref:SHOCT domain-containing protein n=1 Tax=Rossellomorea aquimaris TaxID=189382 RepID=UPI001CD75239|nr:SHOCT domain-containing protein [Rossellomorea aquimaris]MCA1054044.1 SHOCT domain-containing protein [Rossellomorea aquimaris]